MEHGKGATKSAQDKILQQFGDHSTKKSTPKKNVTDGGSDQWNWRDRNKSKRRSKQGSNTTAAGAARSMQQFNDHAANDGRANNPPTFKRVRDTVYGGGWWSTDIDPVTGLVRTVYTNPNGRLSYIADGGAFAAKQKQRADLWDSGSDWAVDFDPTSEERRSSRYLSDGSGGRTWRMDGGLAAGVTTAEHGSRWPDGRVTLEGSGTPAHTGLDAGGRPTFTEENPFIGGYGGFDQLPGFQPQALATGNFAPPLPQPPTQNPFIIPPSGMGVGDGMQQQMGMMGGRVNAKYNSPAPEWGNKFNPPTPPNGGGTTTILGKQFPLNPDGTVDFSGLESPDLANPSISSSPLARPDGLGNALDPDGFDDNPITQGGAYLGLSLGSVGVDDAIALAEQAEMAGLPLSGFSSWDEIANVFGVAGGGQQQQEQGLGIGGDPRPGYGPHMGVPLNDAEYAILQEFQNTLNAQLSQYRFNEQTGEWLDGNGQPVQGVEALLQQVQNTSRMMDYYNAQRAKGIGEGGAGGSGGQGSEQDKVFKLALAEQQRTFQAEQAELDREMEQAKLDLEAEIAQGHLDVARQNQAYLENLQQHNQELANRQFKLTLLTSLAQTPQLIYFLSQSGGLEAFSDLFEGSGTALADLLANVQNHPVGNIQSIGKMSPDEQAAAMFAGVAQQGVNFGQNLVANAPRSPFSGQYGGSGGGVVGGMWSRKAR